MKSIEGAFLNEFLYKYQVAGRELDFDRPVVELAPFFIKRVLAGDALAGTRRLTWTSSPVQTEGWLLDRYLKVTLSCSETGYRIEIPSAGSFYVSRDGKSIFRLNEDLRIDEKLKTEALLGPPLILALALQDTWCLHASAVEYEGKVVVFLGDSGAGKSTLVAYLGGQPGFRRAGDDILPFGLIGDQLTAFPHFPQLKLPVSAQPGDDLPESLPVSAIYLLEEGADISIREQSKLDSALILINKIVAGRLFDQRLLSRNFAFCSQATKIGRFSELKYPRVFSELPRVKNHLLEDLDTLDA